MDELSLERERLALLQVRVKAYDPSQPRNPKGSPDAGKWREVMGDSTATPTTAQLTKLVKVFFGESAKGVRGNSPYALEMRGDVALSSTQHSTDQLSKFGERFGWEAAEMKESTNGKGSNHVSFYVNTYGATYNG